MKKLFLLSIIAISVFVGGCINGIEQTKWDITKQWAKIYAGGFGIGIGSHMLGIPTVARAGFTIGSPIISLINVATHAKDIIPKAIKVALAPANGTVITSMAGKAAFHAIAFGIIVDAAIPAMVGFGAIPYTIEKCNNSLIPWAVEKYMRQRKTAITVAVQ